MLYRTQVAVPRPLPDSDWDPDFPSIPWDVITYEWQFAGNPAGEGARPVAMLDLVSGALTVFARTAKIDEEISSELERFDLATNAGRVWRTVLRTCTTNNQIQLSWMPEWEYHGYEERLNIPAHFTVSAGSKTVQAPPFF